MSDALKIGGRIAGGLVALGAAAALVGAAVVLPDYASTTAADNGMLVTPQAVEQQRACPGPLLRLGDESGLDATAISSFGFPATLVSEGATVTALTDADVIAGDTTSSAVTAPPVNEIGALAATQSQIASETDQTGLSVAACAESTATAWLVAGATDTGRTSLVLLANPSAVESVVDVRVFTQDGEAPSAGLTDLTIAPKSQRVLSLAGYAPGASAIAVQIDSRGGLVVPTLQHSVVRGLEPGGTETASAGAGPSTSQVIPGVRITTAQAAAERAQVGGSADVGTIVRIAAPDDEVANVTIGAVADTAGVPGTTVDARVPAGTVIDVPVEGLGDGTYTFTVDADVPVVASARAATVAAPDPDAETVDEEVSFEIVGDAAGVTVPAGQRIDFAWFASAATLGDELAFAVPDAPAPRLTVTSMTTETSTLTITPAQGAPLSVEVGPGSTASIDLSASTVYRLTGADGLVGSVSYAGEGLLASMPLRPANPLAGPITVLR